MGMVVSPLEFHGKPVQTIPGRMKIIIAGLQVNPKQYVKYTGKCNNQSGNIQQMVEKVPPETAEGVPDDDSNHVPNLIILWSNIIIFCLLLPLKIVILC
jgi:hypothetical protein